MIALAACAAIVVLCFGAVAFIGAPYVPSHRREVREAFTKLRPLTGNDTMIDLGSGDGLVLQESLKAGAGRAIGYELNPFLVVISRMRLLRFSGRSTIHLRNMWGATPAQGSMVVYVFTVSRDTKRLEKMMQSWANTTNRAVDVIVYGHELSEKYRIASHRAHHLYIFQPLQKN